MLTIQDIVQATLGHLAHNLGALTLFKNFTLLYPGPFAYIKPARISWNRSNRLLSTTTHLILQRPLPSPCTTPATAGQLTNASESPSASTTIISQQ